MNATLSFTLFYRFCIVLYCIVLYCIGIGIGIGIGIVLYCINNNILILLKVIYILYIF
jgi:hypothetical protein